MSKNKKVQARKGKKPSAKRIIRKAPPVVETPKKEMPHRGIFRLAPAAFMSLFSGRHMFDVVKNALPPDAKILDVRFDHWEDGNKGAIEVLLEHPSIPALIEGQPIPVIVPPVFQSIQPTGDNIAQFGDGNKISKK